MAKAQFFNGLTMIRLFSVVLFSAFLTGCAFSTVDVNVGYHYDKPVSASYAGVGISVGEIKDVRNLPNPRLLYNFKDGYGQTTTGGLQAEKPLAEIVKGGLQEGLERAQATPGGNLELTGELMDYNTSALMGLWDGSLLGKMIVKLQLRNKVTKEIIWRDTVFGTTRVQSNQATDGWAQILKMTIDSLVTNFLEDPYVRQRVAEKSQ